MSSSLYDQLVWHTYPVPSHAASGEIFLHVGEVGEGGDLATLVAGVHGASPMLRPNASAKA